MIFLYPSGTQYKCCTISAHSNKGIDGSNFAVRPTLVVKNKRNIPNVLCILLAVSEHFVNTSINKTLHSYESTVEEPTTVIIVFKLPTTVSCTKWTTYCGVKQKALYINKVWYVY